MRSETITSVFFVSLAFISCNKNKVRSKPNVVLIMADDMGYECLSCYGSQSYKTPALDSLASHGMLFGRCHSQPLSTPSRVKLMTGLYNYRNYDRDQRYSRDTAYFKEMVAYADKIVGKIAAKLKAMKLDGKTILIFTGDNGTNRSIYSRTSKGIIRGGKGNTIDAGTHVPLIVYWPQSIKKGSVYDGLIEFSDFFPTMTEIAGKEVNCDGRSFYQLLTGSAYKPRKTLSVHYDPRWSKNVNQYRNQFVRTIDYKLYSDGRFFDLSHDLAEKHPLPCDSLSSTEKVTFVFLTNELNKHPLWVRKD